MKHSIIKYLILLLITLASSGSAWALTASNTQIVNQAQLSYFDGAATRTAIASVTVTVSLVPAAPAVTPGPAMSTAYTGPATTLTNSFTITATSNGPDTYNITPNISGTPTNTTGATVAPHLGVTSITLGATVTLAGSSTTLLVVPTDGLSSTNPNKVNGIQVGSWVVVGADLRQVTAVSNNATPTATTITVAALSAVPTAGILVAEQKTVYIDVTAGTIQTSGTSITVTKNITLTSATDNSKTVTSGTVTDTFLSGAATFAKYVRNVTTPATGTGTPYSFNSTNYYPSGITAKPGDTLEYILVATNSGSGPVSAAVVTDALPTTYVTLKANAYGSGKEVTYVSDTNVTSTYSAASDADQATYAAGTLTVYAGTGATNAAGGSIPGSNKFVLVLYQVTVNN